MPRIVRPWTYQTNSGRARIASKERLVNLYPERSNSLLSSNSDATDIVLLSAPGCRPIIDLGDDTQVQGLLSTDREFFAWTEKALYRLNLSNQSVRKLFEGDFGRIIAAHGDATNAQGEIIRYVWWTDGSQSFILNVNFNTVSPLSDDPAFLPASSTTFLDSIAIFSRRNTDEFFWSDVADYDSFNALNFASAEGFPDEIQRIISFERELWIFGSKTIEIWINTGDSTAQFQRLGNAYFEVGCANGNTVVKLSRDLYWVSDDWRVMRNNAGSYNAQPISLHQGVEHDLTQHGAAGMFAFGVTVEGHGQYWLTIPKANRTWVFDEALNIWYERSSLVDGQIVCNKDGCEGEGYGRHVANVGVVHKEIPYVGFNGKIYELDLNYYFDDEEKILREATQSPLRLSNTDSVVYNKVRLDVQNDCGFVDSNCKDQPGDAGVTLNWSDDYGKTWCEGETKWLVRDQKGYKPTWNSLGRAEARTFKWRTFWAGQIAFLRSIMYVEGLRDGD